MKPNAFDVLKTMSEKNLDTEFHKENWVDIIGFEGYYKVSNLGRVHSIKTNRILKHRFTRGYPDVSLCVNGRMKTFTVHRLVAAAFIPNPDNKKTVNHKNGIKLDNQIENLEWLSLKENIRHAFSELGKQVATGEKQGLSKLKENDVSEIRRLLSIGSKLKVISRQFGISISSVHNIKSNKTWSHLN